MKLRISLALTLAAFSVHAGDIGHFNAGVMNIRDYAVPDAGFYGVVYNYYYTTDRINDGSGDKVKSVTVGSATLGLKVNVDLYAVAPALIWVTNIEPLSLKYGALISPMFANANIDATLSTAAGRGGNINSSSFGMGDLFVQPVWFGKTMPHWDFAVAYGFYAPVGKYDTDTITLPVVGPVKVESTDNLGYGFWTQQMQGNITWYPFTNHATAVTSALTYEINGKKQDFAVTPGDVLTVNWGISQYLPLKKDMSLLLEFGPAGYDTWQMTDDTGSAANNNRDEAHAAGGQIGVTYVPWMVAVNFHGFYEYLTKDRTQGASLGINIAKKF